MTVSPETKERLQSESVSKWSLIVAILPIVGMIITGIVSLYVRMAITDTKLEAQSVSSEKAHTKLQSQLESHESSISEMKGDVKVIRAIVERIDKK